MSLGKQGRRKKKEYVEKLAETQIQNHIPLRAAMESEGNKGVVRQYATIEKRKDAYYLEIRNDTEHGPVEIADTFENVDALESYLTASTKFRFGDFIAR